MKRRFLAMLLSLAMVLTMLPVSAFAVGPTGQTLTFDAATDSTNSANVTISNLKADDSNTTVTDVYYKLFDTADNELTTLPSTIAVDSNGYTQSTATALGTGVAKGNAKYIAIATATENNGTYNVGKWGVALIDAAPKDVTVTFDENRVIKADADSPVSGATYKYVILDSEDDIPDIQSGVEESDITLPNDKTLAALDDNSAYTEGATGVVLVVKFTTDEQSATTVAGYGYETIPTEATIGDLDVTAEADAQGKVTLTVKTTGNSVTTVEAANYFYKTSATEIKTDSKPTDADGTGWDTAGTTEATITPSTDTWVQVVTKNADGSIAAWGCAKVTVTGEVTIGDLNVTATANAQGEVTLTVETTDNPATTVAAKDYYYKTSTTEIKTGSKPTDATGTGWTDAGTTAPTITVGTPTWVEVVTKNSDGSIAAWGFAQVTVTTETTIGDLDVTATADAEGNVTLTVETTDDPATPVAAASYFYKTGTTAITKADKPTDPADSSWASATAGSEALKISAGTETWVQVVTKDGNNIAAWGFAKVTTAGESGFTTLTVANDQGMVKVTADPSGDLTGVQVVILEGGTAPNWTANTAETEVETAIGDVTPSEYEADAIEVPAAKAVAQHIVAYKIDSTTNKVVAFGVLTIDAQQSTSNKDKIVVSTDADGESPLSITWGTTDATKGTIENVEAEKVYVSADGATSITVGNDAYNAANGVTPTEDGVVVTVVYTDETYEITIKKKATQQTENNKDKIVVSTDENGASKLSITWGTGADATKGTIANVDAEKVYVTATDSKSIKVGTVDYVADDGVTPTEAGVVVNVVYTEDGEDVTYAITITKKAAQIVKDIKVTAGAATADLIKFVPDTKEYTVLVDKSVTEITITAAGATITNGQNTAQESSVIGKPGDDGEVTDVEVAFGDDTYKIKLVWPKKQPATEDLTADDAVEQGSSVEGADSFNVKEDEALIAINNAKVKNDGVADDKQEPIVIPAKVADPTQAEDKTQVTLPAAVSDALVKAEVAATIQTSVGDVTLSAAAVDAAKGKGEADADAVLTVVVAKETPKAEEIAKFEVHVEKTVGNTTTTANLEKLSKPVKLLFRVLKNSIAADVETAKLRLAYANNGKYEALKDSKAPTEVGTGDNTELVFEAETDHLSGFVVIPGDSITYQPPVVTIDGAESPVKFENNEAGPFEVSEDKNTFTFTVPAGATVKLDGKDDGVSMTGNSVTVTLSRAGAYKVSIFVNEGGTNAEYVINLNKKAAAASTLSVTATALQAAGVTTQNKLAVDSPDPDCTYVFRVRFKSKLPGEWLMFTSGNGEVIVSLDTDGYEVAVFEYDNNTVSEPIVNGSPASGATREMSETDVRAAR